MRIPLPVDLMARLSSTSKDARILNGLREGKTDSVHVKKRPGLVSTGYNYSGVQGGLGLGGSLYLAYGDTFELSEYDGTPIGASVYIGDLVDGYYAMVDDPPTSPGPGDDYWSDTPPDSRRYQAYYNLQLEVYSYNSPDYWAYRGDVYYGSGSISQVPTTALAATRKACVKQALASMPSSCPGVAVDALLRYNDGRNSWSKWVEYFPFAYRFDSSYVDSDSVVLTYLNDTANTGFLYGGVPITICGWASLTKKFKYAHTLTFNPDPPTAPADPSCASASTGYSSAVIQLSRVV